MFAAGKVEDGNRTAWMADAASEGRADRSEASRATDGALSRDGPVDLRIGAVLPMARGAGPPVA